MASLLAALVFAVHPVHVEAVSFVSARTDLLACAFLLLSFLCWARGRQATGAGSRAGWAAGSGLALFLGIASKETAYLLPLALLAWDGLAPAGPNVPPQGWWRRNRPFLAAFLISVGASLALRVLVAGVGAGSGEMPTDGAVVAERLVSYLRLLAIPWPLDPLYTPETVRISAAGIFGAGLCCLLVAMAFFLVEKRAAIWSSLWVLLFLLPALLGVSVNQTPIAERYLYIPSVGACVVAGLLLARLRESGLPRIVRLSPVALLIVALATGSVLGSRVWRNDLTLFSHPARRNPRSEMALAGLGDAYLNAGRDEDALAAYRAALEVNPRHAPVLLVVAEINSLKGNREDALVAYRRAAEVDPLNAVPYYGMGVLEGQVGAWDKAVVLFEKALRLRPEMAEASYALGTARAYLGQWDLSVRAYREAVRLRPENASWRYFLALSCLSGGDRQCVEEQREVLRIADPRLASRLDAALLGSPAGHP